MQHTQFASTDEEPSSICVNISMSSLFLLSLRVVQVIFTLPCLNAECRTFSLSSHWTQLASDHQMFSVIRKNLLQICVISPRMLCWQAAPFWISTSNLIHGSTRHWKVLTIGYLNYHITAKPRIRTEVHTLVIVHLQFSILKIDQRFLFNFKSSFARFMKHL